MLIVAVRCILWRVDLVILDFGVLSNDINLLIYSQLLYCSNYPHNNIH